MTTPAVFDVTGKRILVTGAGRGIGKGIAQVLAAAGADVAINALTAKYAAPLAEGLAKETGRKVVAVTGDVTTASGAQGVVDGTIAQLGGVDVLINALGDSIRKPLVGLPGKDGAFQQISEADLRFIVDINLTEALMCTRAVGPHMLKRGSGKVINISSFTAQSRGADLVLYTAGKAALTGFTRTQALEWAPYGLTVNAIAPGMFPDPVTSGEEAAAATRERARTAVPLGRVGELKEVGYLALYLSSAASDYMTGQTLIIDGGVCL
jgi:NAD(P)-dependent dehydrogenase (short-subunit alcohol dehydrogenase family)